MNPLTDKPKVPPRMPPKRGGDSIAPPTDYPGLIIRQLDRIAESPTAAAFSYSVSYLEKFLTPYIDSLKYWGKINEIKDKRQKEFKDQKGRYEAKGQLEQFTVQFNATTAEIQLGVLVKVAAEVGLIPTSRK